MPRDPVLGGITLAHDACLRRLRAEHPEAAAIARALTDRGCGPLCYGGRVRWFSDGDSCFSSLLTDIRAAERTVRLESGRVPAGVVWDTLLTALRQRAARGVDVQLDVGRAPGLREASLMHIGRTGRGPFAPEGTAVLIDGRIRYAGLPALCDAFAGLRGGKRPRLDLCARWEAGGGYCYAMPLGVHAAEAAAMHMIARAERSVRLLCPGPDAELTEALLRAERAGARVHIITGGCRAAPQVGEAVCAGARVRATACCVDGTLAVLGNPAGGLWLCGDGAAGLEDTLAGLAEPLRGPGARI